MKIRVISLRSPNRRLQMAQWLEISPDVFTTLPFLIKLSELTEQQYRDVKITTALRLWTRTTAEGEIIYLTPQNPEELQVLSNSLQPVDIHWQRMASAYNEYFSGKNTVWEWKDHKLDFANGPFIMGILNTTPDSFSDGGKFLEIGKAVDHALQMAEDGADIIDIGGESTRPGSKPVSVDEEQDRILPVIEKLRTYSNVLISVDTYKSAVAGSAIEAGADIVNDISAGLFDPAMSEIVIDAQVPYIIMHIKGTPRDMQQNPVYRDATDEIYTFFEQRIMELTAAGHSKIMIDPGIGFGKRLQDNLELIRNLDEFRFLGFPVLIGTSRKSFIGQLLNKNVEDRLAGTLSSVSYAIENGADIIRVHDVKQVRDLLTIRNAIDNC